MTVIRQKVGSPSAITFFFLQDPAAAYSKLRKTFPSHSQDFVLGLSVLLRGSVTEKLRWAFNLYDINKDGYVTKEVTDLMEQKLSN